MLRRANMLIAHALGRCGVCALLTVSTLSCVRTLPVVDEADAAQARPSDESDSAAAGASATLPGGAASGDDSDAAEGRDSAQDLGDKGAAGAGHTTAPAAPLWNIIDGPDFGRSTTPIEMLRREVAIELVGEGHFSGRAWVVRGSSEYASADLIVRLTNDDPEVHCNLGAGHGEAVWLGQADQPLELQTQEVGLPFGALGRCLAPGATAYISIDLLSGKNSSGDELVLIDELKAIELPISVRPPKMGEGTDMAFLEITRYALTEDKQFVLGIKNVSAQSLVELDGDGHFMRLDAQDVPLGMTRISYPNDVPALAPGEEAEIHATPSYGAFEYEGTIEKIMFVDAGHPVDP